MIDKLLRAIFPPKCVLCRKVLTEDQTDLCHQCRTEAPEFSKSKFRPSFVARWTAIWYYKDTVRQSLLRYKFSGKRHYAGTYGRLLAMKLQTAEFCSFDVMTWVPVGSLRRLKRGYDQGKLLAMAVADELGTQAVPLLKKVRNTPPQSGIPDASRRRANVLNAYEAINTPLLRGKSVLLLDDVLTTGATASECARILLTAGAKEVTFAAVAVAPHNQ